MPKEIKISRNLRDEFHNFLSTHPPAQFSNDLRRLVIDYLDDAVKKGIFPTYLDNFLWPLNDLLDLLDTATKEFTSQLTVLEPSIKGEKLE
jgi:hypothetical protein